MALTKLARTLAQGLPSSRCSAYIGARMITGKAMREVDPNKPKPFDQDRRDFTPFWQIFDKTTLRFDENTKLIAVGGSHAIGKTKFAKELAEELDMLYFQYPSITNTMIDSYGVDMRQYNENMVPIFRTYDEMDFLRNPLGPMEGCCDRFLIDLYMEKFRSHLYALRHIFNSGQGVVLEGCPMMDYAYFEAAYNQGWVDRETRKFYKEMCRMTLHTLMRPNLYIYLDAPVDVVMKNIEARGNEWDKNSPVWTKQYLADIYNELKRNFLKEQQQHSRVLVYDWTEPGELEIVVEDIEALNFDYLEANDDQQKDWRLHNEEGYAVKRLEYCNYKLRMSLLMNLGNQRMLSATNLWYDPDACQARDELLQYIKCTRYAYGYNEDMGDKSVMFRNFPFLPRSRESWEKQNRTWSTQRWSRPRVWHQHDGI